MACLVSADPNAARSPFTALRANALLSLPLEAVTGLADNDLADHRANPIEPSLKKKLHERHADDGGPGEARKKGTPRSSAPCKLVGLFFW